VKEGLGQATHSFEAEVLPDADGAEVGTHHEVELHGAKTALAGALQGMGAHEPGQAATGCARRGHITAVGHVSTTALLIGTEVVRGDNVGAVIGDEDFVARGEPVEEGLLAGEITGQGIGLAGTDSGFQDAPNGIVIALGCWSDDYVHRFQYR